MSSTTADGYNAHWEFWLDQKETALPSARLLPFLVSAGVRVFQALHEEQPAFLKTLPEERVFKESKWPGFPGVTG
jgi:hypothetical protein